MDKKLTVNKSTNKKHISDYEINDKHFWSGVTTVGEDDCWPWTRALNTGGYGLFSVKTPPDIYEKTGRLTMQVLAHRVAAHISHGVKPHDYVMHKCDNPKCCNPKHLQVGTALDNLLDAKAKGRWNGNKKVLA